MLLLPVNQEDHKLGPISASVHLVEYGNFGCLRCGAAYSVIKRIKQWLGEHLCFVFRHFPLSSEHSRAWQAAEMAEAAGAQGRFWQMHDYLFEHQQQEGNDLLTLVDAAGFGLDASRFERDVVLHHYLQYVQEDFKSGVKSGIRQTPTFFLNGVRHEGSWQEAELMEVIEEAGLEQEECRRSLRSPFRPVDQ